MSVTDAAPILGVHRVTVHMWIRYGVLPARRRHRGRAVLRLADVLAFRAKARKRQRRIERLKAAA